MRVLRGDEVNELAAAIPDEPGRLQPEWLEGPFNSNRLDVGLVTVSRDGGAPPHVHIGGQVIVVLAGRGFVETRGDRVDVGPGDVVIAPPGELHSHGAAGDSSF